MTTQPSTETTSNVPVIAAEEVRTRTLNTLDRCDACGSQAYVRVTLLTLRPLLFCGNHYRRNETDLWAIAGHIKDERWALRKDVSADRVTGADL
jgi:hypothetical protein